MMVYVSKDKLWWNEHTKAEIVEHAKKNDIVLWPLGSIEQHGDHLPTGEDTYHGIEISERVARKTGVMLLPPPWYGAHPYHHYYFAGTVPLSPETFLGMVEDVVKGAAVAGYNKFVLLNVHGQEWILPVVIQKLALQNYFVIAPTLWEIMRKEFNEILETYFIHACEAETSLGLAIVPQLVNMKAAYDEERENLLDDKWFSAPSEAGPIFAFAGTFYRPEYLQMKHGSIGFPTKGTAQKGEKILDVATNKMVDLIEEIKRRYPPGVKPPVTK
jgi:creatinine amidohydrolase/Fe(II)-dependent formamide hydrolase-like protein